MKPYLALPALFFAASALAQPAGSPGDVTRPAPMQPASRAPANSEALIEAARNGDENVMRRLTGTPVTLEGRFTRTLRETENYLDIGVFTGPDFKLAGGQSGIEVVLRIPRSIVPDPLPHIISSSGTLTGFEPPGAAGEPYELGWTPIIEVDFLR